MSLDHGILNVPLAKRGDIDAQIDAYKAAESRSAAAALRAHQKARRAWIAEARAIVAAMSMGRLADLGTPHGLTAKQAGAMLVNGVRTYGERALIALRKEAA